MTTYFVDITAEMVPQISNGSLCEGLRLIRRCPWAEDSLVPGMERWQVEDQYAAPHYEGKLLDLTFRRVGLNYVYISDRRIIKDEE